MEYRELGSTGIQAPVVGLGTWEYRGGVAPLHEGVALGATLIDTAEIYGTEGVVGEAIAGMREKVFVATKVSGDHLRYDQVLKACEQSLRRLRIDCIDLYQVHWPNARVPIAETMRALEELVDAGKVRYIGVSNFSVPEMEAAQAALKKHRIVSNQVIYSLLDREVERDVIPYCERHKITVMAYSPLARGALTGQSSWRGWRQSLKVLHRVAQETGKTPAQVALNWCLAKPSVITIPKSDKAHRVRENCGAAGWMLAPEHLQALDEAFSDRTRA